MTTEQPDTLDDYYAKAGSWADERTEALYASRKVAWIVAMVATAVAVLLTIALLVLLPLKTVEPHTILVDKQTGFVQALDPAAPQKIAPQKALTQSFLVQYVEAREGFDLATVKGQFKKVALWSSGSAKSRYVNLMQANNPESPLSRLPRTTIIDVQIRSVSQLSDNSALVRFASIRRDQGAAEQPMENWVAVIKYRYSTVPMTVEDRYVNPLGFEVVDYRKDAETLPNPAPMPVQANPNPALSAPVPSQAQPLPQRSPNGVPAR
jgi:type IV secretion system protein VirB8